MFLNKILEKNAKLVECCVELHQKGCIPANSYVIDLDYLAQNAKYLAEKAKQNNLRVLAMTKQIGRNPVAMKVLKENGIDSCVCVDMNDARPVYNSGLKVGHLGHLVQVPNWETQAALNLSPEYWTVFNLDKVYVIAKNLKPNQTQKVMLRIYDDCDTFYKGHEGGFHINTLLETVHEIEQIQGIKFAGITTFPTQLFNKNSMSIEHNQNYKTLLKAKDMLAKAGYTDIEVNAPGTTCGILFEEMGKAGVTQVEPGHGLTGTTPLHAFADLEEKPAMVYVSEVSHFFGGKPYCFGGGMYIDPVFDAYPVKACVGSIPEKTKDQLIECDMPSPAAIDYYGILQPEPEHNVKVGDTVVFGFRAQTFVTRAYMVPVSGIHSGKVKVEGIFSTDGRTVGWPEC